MGGGAGDEAAWDGERGTLVCSLGFGGMGEEGGGQIPDVVAGSSWRRGRGEAHGRVFERKQASRERPRAPKGRWGGGQEGYCSMVCFSLYPNEGLSVHPVIHPSPFVSIAASLCRLDCRFCQTRRDEKGRDDGLASRRLVCACGIWARLSHLAVSGVRRCAAKLYYNPVDTGRCRHDCLVFCGGFVLVIDAAGLQEVRVLQLERRAGGAKCI